MVKGLPISMHFLYARDVAVPAPIEKETYLFLRKLCVLAQKTSSIPGVHTERFHLSLRVWVEKLVKETM